MRACAAGKPSGYEDKVIVSADLKGVSGICADSGLAGFKSSIEPIPAFEKVRFVGAARGLSRADAPAEDIAELVSLDSRNAARHFRDDQSVRSRRAAHS